MEKLENKIDKIIEQIIEINVTMARNTVSLEEHIKRTKLLEERMEPIERHVIMVNSVIKFLIGSIGLAATAIAIYKAL